MSQAPPPGQGKPHWTVVSVALLLIGLLIFLPAALCTVLVGSLFVTDPSGADASSVMAIFVFGGLPMAVGALLIWAGWKARSRD